MNHEALDPVGARVTDVQIDELRPRTASQLRQLLARHGVLVFPDQEVDDHRFLAFLRSFGELAFTKGETPLEGFPELNFVSNVGRTSPPKSNFHVDTSYVRRPPAYTALRAARIPEHGGGTLFTNQYRAYSTLPDDVRRELQGRTITHVVTGVELGPDDEASAEHPVFRRHPVSGRVALYMTTPARCAAVSGLGEQEAQQMIAYLFEHSTREENTLRHRWAAGDVVMWDNGCVLHRADHSRVQGDRLLHRGMVAAYGPDAG